MRHMTWLRSLALVSIFLAMACSGGQRSDGGLDASVDAADASPTDAAEVDGSVDGSLDASVDASVDAGSDATTLPAYCRDGRRSGDETAIDCGGSCLGCDAGSACAFNRDCASGICDHAVCQSASCVDGTLNGDETDVDCGGSCPSACPVGLGCAVDADCIDNVCRADLCIPAMCADGALSDTETDVDCGGEICDACGDGLRCVLDSDCASTRCLFSFCLASSCTNGVLDSGEADIDCGGACPLCPSGSTCTAATDCASGTCEGGSCVAGARSCFELFTADPSLPSGMYEIQPDPAGAVYGVYCDMTTDGGGWTLVASTLGGTLNDERSDWYADLSRPVPTAAHTGIWDGLRPLFAAAGDVRFTCNTTPSAPGETVDLSVYEVGWYNEWTLGSDDMSCFEQSSATHTLPAPARRDNLAGTTLPLGDNWNAGYLVGEDSCSDTGDFTIDFDDRGMDSNQSDGTDWGEDDGTAKCGVSGVSGASFQIWARPSACADGVRDGLETDVDCGGSCPLCVDGLSCGGDADCESGRCEAGTCTSCADGAQNGTESDVDCGGSCHRCVDGLSCGVDADCASDRCEAGTCTSCSDGLLNGDEVNIDCGGSCLGCPGGSSCSAGVDCASGECNASVCAAPRASCAAIHAAFPANPSGAYTLLPDPTGAPATVYCDMTTDGGGWTLVASTRTTTLNDQASAYYDDLATLDPASGHQGVWDGMRPVMGPSSDLRFSCRADPRASAFTVDLVFRSVAWYAEIATGTDAAACFEQNAGAGYTRPAPARTDLIAGVSLPLGDDWNASGYLEGEDSCGDTGDFTVDFDDRGMDSNESDGTDWGEDDSSPKCGVRALADGQWFIWARELP